MPTLYSIPISQEYWLVRSGPWVSFSLGYLVREAIKDQKCYVISLITDSPITQRKKSLFSSKYYHVNIWTRQVSESERKERVQRPTINSLKFPSSHLIPVNRWGRKVRRWDNPLAARQGWWMPPPSSDLLSIHAIDGGMKWLVSFPSFVCISL